MATSSRVHHRIWAQLKTCVALSREPHNGARHRLNLISCADTFRVHSLKYSFFACMSSNEKQRLECPRGWTTTTVENSGRRLEVGKCFKRLNQSYNMTWDGARALCLREAATYSASAPISRVSGCTTRRASCSLSPNSIGQANSGCTWTCTRSCTVLPVVKPRGVGPHAFYTASSRSRI